jgi:hypothetical protein
VPFLAAVELELGFHSCLGEVAVRYGAFGVAGVIQVSVDSRVQRTHAVHERSQVLVAGGRHQLRADDVVALAPSVNERPCLLKGCRGVVGRVRCKVVAHAAIVSRGHQRIRR